MRLSGLSPIFLLILILVVHSGAVRIVEFCPDPYLKDDPDEYIVLEGSGSLDGLTVSDGEGGFRFPEGSRINGTITIAKNADAFRETHGEYPDFEWFNYTGVVPEVIRGGSLALGNVHDDLFLYSQDTLLQSVRWPEDVSAREGQIHYLEEGAWDRRPLFVGQSRFRPKTYDNVTLTTFASPDSSREVLVSAIGSAHHEIHLNVYEFSSPSITDAILNAAANGTKVTILLEGGPVGGISAVEKSAVFRMNTSGIPVYRMQSTAEAHAPYRYDHAKYFVVDGSGVLITSENFGESGIPAPGTSGNRGWGVYVQDSGVAGYFDSVFRTDLGSRYIEPFSGTEGSPESPGTAAYIPHFSAHVFSGARVTPVLAPDTSYLILDLITSAQREIDIEQAYITNESGTRLNPYLAAAVNASRRGVHVRVLLDSYWYNLEDTADNDEMVRTINSIAVLEKLPLEARLVDTGSTGFDKIHNKGVIVDQERVLISSINWNTNSPNFNREAGIIIDHAGVAKYFGDVFQYDWETRKEKSQGTDYLKTILAVSVLLICGFFIWRRYR